MIGVAVRSNHSAHATAITRCAAAATARTRSIFVMTLGDSRPAEVTSVLVVRSQIWIDHRAPLRAPCAMHTLYGSSVSGNCWKPAFMLAQRELPFRWVEIDIFE